jgi:hypothetical protein
MKLFFDILNILGTFVLSKNEVCVLVNILIVDPHEYIFFIQSLYEVVKSLGGVMINILKSFFSFGG